MRIGVVHGLLVGPVNAASAPGGCPNGFEGPVDYDGLLLTPEISLAISDGIYPAEHVADVLPIVDKNGDDLVCWKSVGNDNDHFMVKYAGRYVDNNAAPK